MRTVKNRTTLSIIGDRYLDIKFDDEYVNSIEVELKQRGVSGLYRWVLEYIAASSLWWSLLWWDRCELSAKDMKIGWGQNILVFGLSAGLMALIFNIYVGLIILLTAHLTTLWLGLRIRSATRL